MNVLRLKSNKIFKYNNKIIIKKESHKTYFKLKKKKTKTNLIFLK